MPYILSISIILLILCLPITARGHSLGHAEGAFLLQNLKVGVFPSIAFRIEYTEKGLVLAFNNKKKPMKNAKTTRKGLSIALNKIDMDKLNTLRLKSIEINGYVGTSDAASTAIISVAIKSAFMMMLDFLPKAEKNSINILPNYQKEGLNINFKFSLQFNLLIIIFLLVGILIKNTNQIR